MRVRLRDEVAEYGLRLCPSDLKLVNFMKDKDGNPIFDALSFIYRNHPGYRTLLNTLGPIENFFPRLCGVTPGSFHMWQRKHKDFERHGWDVITYVGVVASSSEGQSVLTSAYLRSPRSGEAERIFMSRTSTRYGYESSYPSSAIYSTT